MRDRRLQLTDGDLEVFRWLWMLRVMSLGQIRRVRYYQSETAKLSALDNVRKRLKRMWDVGFLIGDRLLESKERIYYLGPKAIAPLCRRYDFDQSRIYKVRPETERQVHHPLLVSECAIRLWEAARNGAVDIPELSPLSIPFYTTHIVGDPKARRHVARFVTQQDISVSRGREPFRIRPDLVFALRRGTTGRLFFLEADRGTESPQELLQKQLGYHRYAQALDPKVPTRYQWQLYGTPNVTLGSFRVLVVTTTKRRIASLRSALGSSPGHELLFFTTEKQLTEYNPIFDGIWEQSAADAQPLMR